MNTQGNQDTKQFYRPGLDTITTLWLCALSWVLTKRFEVKSPIYRREAFEVHCFVIENELRINHHYQEIPTIHMCKLDSGKVDLSQGLRWMWL